MSSYDDAIAYLEDPDATGPVLACVVPFVFPETGETMTAAFRSEHVAFRRDGVDVAPVDLEPSDHAYIGLCLCAEALAWVKERVDP